MSKNRSKFILLIILMLVAFLCYAENVAFINDLYPIPFNDATNATAYKNVTTFEQQILDIINTQRIAADISPLIINTRLCAIAAIRAEEASILWSHTRPNGSGCEQIFNELGINWTHVGENLARTESSVQPKSIVDAWLESQTHRKNILNTNFAFCGIATYQKSQTTYISLIFFN